MSAVVTDERLRRLPIYIGTGLLALTIFALFAVIQLDEMEGLWLVAAGLGAFAFFVVTLVRPFVGLLALVALSSVVDFQSLLQARVFVNEIPLNVMDLAIFLALPVLLLTSSRSKSVRSRSLRESPFALPILLLIFVFWVWATSLLGNTLLPSLIAGCCFI